jgi:two-component system LytT family response regulator
MLKAIIVDDEPYCCEILAAMLESDCPEVEIKAICNNAKDALAAIRQQSPDLVFLDVEMPKMNGFEMLEQLPSINFSSHLYNQLRSICFKSHPVQRY